MSDSGVNRQQALIELRARAALGRQLLARPVGSEEDLEALTDARIDWTLGNKKLLHQIFGDAVGQIRFPHTAQHDDLPLNPRLEDRVREFQELMIDQLADVEMLIRMLARLEE